VPLRPNGISSLGYATNLLVPSGGNILKYKLAIENPRRSLVEITVQSATIYIAKHDRPKT
jgi:hypothetical protein